MALKHSGKAIGMVSELVREYLERYHPAVADESLEVKLSRPKMKGTNPLLTLFLYEALIDPYLRNTSPVGGKANWLWYELHFLLTAFDASGASDNEVAQGYLGEAARILQGLGTLPVENVVPPLDPAIVVALKDNPETLHLTFEPARPDLIARVMSSSDEYHFSLAFQVRPVMIAPAESAQFSQQVGIDYNNNNIVGEAGIQTEILPSMGPVLDEIVPAAFRPGDTIFLAGSDLAGASVQAWLGELELPIIAQTATGLKCTIPAAIDNGDSLLAGDYALRVSIELSSGRKIWSNSAYAGLLPKISGGSATNVVKLNHPSTLQPVITADLELTGNLLGKSSANVMVGLVRDGVLKHSFDSFTFAAPNHQMSLAWSLTVDDQVSPGTYLVLLRVNGQQARTSINFILDL